MTDLNSLLAAGKRDAVVADLTNLVDKTVANQSGLTGMALKSAVAAGKKADADAISKGVNRFLPQIASELQPHFDKYENDNAATFGAYLSSHEDQIVETILSAADQATGDMPGAVQKVYSSLRGKAGKIIGPALPELGDVIERHVR